MKWKLVFFFSQSRNVMREFIFIMKKLILVEEDTLHVTLCRLRIHVTLSTATKQTHEIQG